ncbi:hypothetical protein [Candidatus Clostridium stratigraminis]|uniref:Fimbrial assembly protein (PilN) n=1 Tax=Candidatus Clostridium stratigraminis TaxID=3381661 RepID=A0ABW8T2N1_9CLOT
MENIKFVSVKFQEVELRNKIQKYKITVCMLWLLSLLFFLALMYFNNLNKQYEKNINLKKVKASSPREENLLKEFDTINNFIEFYTGINNNLVFNDIEVNGSEIKLDVLTDQKNIFNDIVNTLEHSSKYKIKYLSPIDENNSKYGFKITLEVKK